MIYELRTYTFHAGKLPAYLKLQEEVGRPVRGDDYGKCHGYWTAEFGPLNQVWHLWSYASLDDRAQQRDALATEQALDDRIRAERPPAADAPGHPLPQPGEGHQPAENPRRGL